MKLLQEVVRHRDDVAPDRVGLDDVQHFSRTRPQKFDLWVQRHDLERSSHERDGITPCIGHSSSEDGHDRPLSAVERRDDVMHLPQRQERSDVELDPSVGQPADESPGADAGRVGHWQLHVDVGPQEAMSLA